MLDIWDEYGFTDVQTPKTVSLWKQYKDRLIDLEREGLL